MPGNDLADLDPHHPGDVGEKSRHPSDILDNAGQQAAPGRFRQLVIRFRERLGRTNIARGRLPDRLAAQDDRQRLHDPPNKPVRLIADLYALGK